MQRVEGRDRVRMTLEPEADGRVLVTHDIGGWAALYRFEPGPAGPVLVSLTIEPWGDRPSTIPAAYRPTASKVLTGRLLRRMQVGAAMREASAIMEGLLALPETAFGDEPTQLPAEIATLTERWREAAARAVTPPQQRAARTVRLAATAAAYVANRGNPAPVRLVAEAQGRPVAAVRDDLHSARLAGYLTGRGRGMAGGELTPEAERVLRAGSTNRGPDGAATRGVEPGMGLAVAVPRGKAGPKPAPLIERVRVSRPGSPE